MRIAFAIVSLFPGGGLQRDCVDIARRIRNSGHDVTIFTSRTSDIGFAEDVPIRILDVGKPSTNHGRQLAFSEGFEKATRGSFDLIVGFDKLFNLDILYCSDRSTCAHTAHNPLLRLLPRYSTFINLEKASFSLHRKTKILLLSETQLNEYRAAWSTEQDRLVVLPATLVPERRRPEYRNDGTRDKLRTRLGLLPNELAWVAVGVQPHTKGLDRTIRALPLFQEARLLVIGLSDTDIRAEKCRDIAQKLGVSERIVWLGHREDIPELMAAADIFLHPARYDTTGTVILEAIVNGLPVITTSACGYAKHVSAANAGSVIDKPFRQSALVDALKIASDSILRDHWSRLGVGYGENKSLYEGKSRATELIIAYGAEISALTTAHSGLFR